MDYKNEMRTRVKVVVQRENADTPCWPCINYDVDGELEKIMTVLRARNPYVDFDVVQFTELMPAVCDYGETADDYDGFLVLIMTCWKKIDLFYATRAEEDEVPVIIADVPFFGSGSMLSELSHTVREENYPVPLISSSNYDDIAEAVKLFEVINKMKKSKILVIADKPNEAAEKKASEIWGCEFINRTSKDFDKYFEAADENEALALAERWKKEAAAVVEPTDGDIAESARIYLALQAMKDEAEADAITVDCLTLSYNNVYGNKTHMYPCLSHFEMNKNGEVAVCEADINAAVSALLTLYLTGRPGYVSDPVVDTYNSQIIYSHCVACTKVFGKSDPRTCDYYIRSHAEDHLGASVQVIFPAGEKLTTTSFNFPKAEACVHSSVSVGNMGGDMGCRSKLVASANAEKLLNNWMQGWHRVTVFGDYRRQFMNLYKMKNIKVNEEDK